MIPVGGMPDSVTLGEAREWLRIQAAKKGAKCPCCARFTKIWKRQVTKSSVLALNALRKADWAKPGAFHRIASLIENRHADEAKLVHWGLIEEAVQRDPVTHAIVRRSRDDTGRAGHWRITPHGRDWLAGRVTIHHWIWLYDARLLRIGEEQITAQEALGTEFDLRELLAGEFDDEEESAL